ncbi:hypothetical protein J5N97_016820 [Dioscorea zingiberensis]|uniref:Cytochrome P450 n=1 Tax=Dioscorea zingiberensis TaxID=325984 RepID=A0A9D5CKL5_9LILI|nr:hypothetical protein J5N97_016820 [Dioscorea zingiberensis]
MGDLFFFFPKYCNGEEMAKKELMFELLKHSWLLIIPSILLLLLLSSRRRRQKLPPGPWQLPILGNIHQLGLIAHRSLLHLAEKHGPLMYLQLGRIPTIVVSSPDIASEILKTLDLAFASRPSTSPSVAKFWYGGRMAKYDEHWRQIRKFGRLKIYNMKQVQSFRRVREDEVDVLIQTIRRSSSSPVNLRKLFVFMTNNITSREAFGKRISDDGECNWRPDHDLFKEILQLLGQFSIRQLLLPLEWLHKRSGLKEKLEKTFERMDQLFEREIEKHCSCSNRDGDGDGDGDEDGKRDLLSVLLKYQADSNLGFSFTKDDVKAIIQGIFFGSTDTTSSILEWLISELIKNPRVMKKAQDEVRGVVGNKGKVEESDLQQLQYLKLVINETLRLHPPGPLLAPRECREECNVQGYKIPVGTMVIVNAWAIMRDPKLWENPDDFIPERFDGVAMNYRGQHFQFIPFGAGRRMCPGMQLGIAIVEITIANVLYHFNWELPAGTDMDMTESMPLALRKKSPLILKATPRMALV